MLKGLIIIATFLLVFVRNKLSHVGKSRIVVPFTPKKDHMISIGDGTIIHKYGWIQGQVAINVNYKEISQTVTIGNNCYIGHFSHIIGSKLIRIEDSVLIADRVCILDCTHGWQDIHKPIKDQPINFVDEVVIKHGAWVGEGVTTMGCDNRKKFNYRQIQLLQNQYLIIPWLQEIQLK